MFLGLDTQDNSFYFFSWNPWKLPHNQKEPYPDTIETSTSGFGPCRYCDKSLQNFNNNPHAAFELLYKSTIAKQRDAFGAYEKENDRIMGGR